jgi:hypothetical protein
MPKSIYPPPRKALSFFSRTLLCLPAIPNLRRAWAKGQIEIDVYHKHTANALPVKPDTVPTVEIRLLNAI